MKEEIYYRGYLRINNYKEQIKLIDSEYRLVVYANHMYNKVKYQDAYDCDGNFIQRIAIEKNETIQETKVMDSHFNNVVQIGYKFYLIPLGFYTQPESEHATSILNNSNLGSFNCGYSCANDLYRLFNCDGYNNDYIKERVNYEFETPKEICGHGNTFWITRKSYSNFINLDLKKYELMKNQFIKDNPDYKAQVEYLYESNIGAICAFYMSTPKQIKAKRFNKLNNTINRLNFNINIKNR